MEISVHQLIADYVVLTDAQILAPAIFFPSSKMQVAHFCVTTEGHSSGPSTEVDHGIFIKSSMALRHLKLFLVHVPLKIYDQKKFQVPECHTRFYKNSMVHYCVLTIPYNVMGDPPLSCKMAIQHYFDNKIDCT